SLVGRDAGHDVAAKLVGVINRIERVAFWEHPDAADLARSPKAEWLFYPRDSKADHRWLQHRTGEKRIVLAPGKDGHWRFSAQTAADLDDLYDSLSDLDVLAGLTSERDLSFSLWLESKMPRTLVDNEFLQVDLWQWIGLLVLILAGVVLDFFVRFLVAWISRRIIAKREGEASRETIRRMIRPFGLAAAAAFWLWTVSLLGLPGEVLKVVLPAVRFFAMLALVWAGFRLTDLVGEVAASKAAKTESKFDDLLIPLLRKTVKIFIFIFGLIYIADSLQIEIAPLLAGLGIGGIGFAFAARDTLENFFGSVTVVADRPFQVGDWVQVGDTEGTVENLGFRSTRIRTFYNSLVTIPNGNLVRAVVDNFGRRKYRRWKTHIAITYDTPPDRIDAFCEGVRELIRLHPYTRKDYYQVWLHQFGDSSLDILVYMFHEAPDWTTELRERHRIITDIIRLANRLDVHFAFPTRTLHMVSETADGRPPAPPQPKRDADERAMRQGRRAVHQMTAEAEWRRGRPEPYVFRGAASPESDDDDEDEGETQIESKIGGDAG
ncbi:MAG: mechanosensitive ion channel domain-containing protein, partial [Planctomycetota bacterium]